MSIPLIDAGSGGGSGKGMAVKMTESLAATYPSAGSGVVKAAVDPSTAGAIDTAVDYTTHRIPPGAETLGEAVADLPNDIMSFSGDWFDGLFDWFDNIDFLAPIAGITNIMSGGLLNWLMIGFVSMKILDMGSNMIKGPRIIGPVTLTYYKMSASEADAVAVYLQKQANVEVRDQQPAGEGMVMIGVPAYHSGVTDRALAQLKKKHGLEYTKL